MVEILELNHWWSMAQTVLISNENGSGCSWHGRNVGIKSLVAYPSVSFLILNENGSDCSRHGRNDGIKSLMVYGSVSLILNENGSGCAGTVKILERRRSGSSASVASTKLWVTLRPAMAMVVSANRFPMHVRAP